MRILRLMRCSTPLSVLLLATLIWGLVLPVRCLIAGDSAIEEAQDQWKRGATDPFEQRGRASALRKLGRIGGEEAAKAVLPAFEDPFVHLRDHAVSAWITMLKGDRGAETAAWLSTKALKHRSPAVRRDAAVALATTDSPTAADAVAERIRKERDADVLVALIGAWGRSSSRASIDLAKLVRHKDGRVALAVAEALAARGESTTMPPSVYPQMLAHKDPMGRAGGVVAAYRSGALDLERARAIGADPHEIPRLALAQELAEDGPSLPWDPVGRELLRLLLADASWRVRAAAVATAVSRWRADVVPLLIERLELERGRLRLDVADALATLSGKNLGPDPDLWKGWWAAQGADFDPGRRPHGKRPVRPAASDEAGGTRAASFFRLPVLGERVAFLIDSSGSMRDVAVEGDESGRTKMDVAREELGRTLNALDSGVHVDVFMYRYPSEFPPRPVMTRALGRLSACTPKTIKKAVTWLDRQEPKGWGAFSDALDALLQEDVDTIYFLTDGRPSRGRYDRDFRLVAELERANRFRQVVVHTVLAGKQRADREFLEELAGATGGHFADATGTP